MTALEKARVIERFHIAFLDVLSRRVDPSRYVLKGGANLRYFHGSLRYSEDLDLDLVHGMPWNLEQQVDAVVESGPVGLLLRSAGCRVADSSKPKQTATTRRWKIAIEPEGDQRLVRTKVELSARNGDSRYRTDPIPDRIVGPLAMRAPMVQHYMVSAAIEQKVLALASRSETQARDVFDLDLLLRQEGVPSGGMPQESLTDAAERAMDLPYASFRDQVLPFLEQEALELYADEATWEAMRAFVAERLLEAA